MTSYIEVPLLAPLERDFDEGETIVLWETDTRSLNFKLVETALKGEKRVRVIPFGETLQ